MLINVLVTIFYGYLLVGALFGLYFVGWGASRIDSTAHHMVFVLRMMLWPASIALWPLLLWKIWRQQRGS